MREADSGSSRTSVRAAYLLGRALDCVSDGICLTDLKGRPLFANVAYRRLRPATTVHGQAAALSSGHDLGPSDTSRLVTGPDGTPCAWLHVLADPAETSPSRRASRESEARELVIDEHIAKDGSRVCRSTPVNPLVNADRSRTKRVTASGDVTAAREREALMRWFSKGVLAAQEAERKRVAGELHDGLAQSLAALGVALRQVEQSVHAGDTAQRDRVRGAVDSVKALIEDTRRMAHHLTPAILEDIGLGAAIDRLLRTFADTPNASIGRDVIALDGLFRPEEEIQIYRVLQEVFNNIHRHAAARRIDLTIRRAGHAVEFAVRDDGVGFEVERILRSPRRDVDHQGLLGLQERARLLSGTLTIHSAPRRGTAVVLTIPVSGALTPACSGEVTTRVRA